MIVQKSSKYNRDYKKIIIDKHLKEEKDQIDKIEGIITKVSNLHELMLSPAKTLYHIEQKKGNLKELFTVRINNKLRLVMKPVDNYPYNYIEIVEIEFLEIDDKHYGEG